MTDANLIAGIVPPSHLRDGGGYVTCVACGGAGIVFTWSFGVKEPDECSGCYGSGRNWRYRNGMIAKHYAGPFVGRDPQPETPND